MYDKEIIREALISRFSALGKELGFSKLFVQNISGWETHVCMIRGEYALRMEIVWYGITGVFVNVVKLAKDPLLKNHTGYPTLDDSWEPVTLNQIYHVPSQRHKKKKRAPIFETLDEAAPFYFSRLDKQLELIRSDPDVLLTFIRSTAPRLSSQPGQREQNVIERPHKRKAIALCILFAVVYCIHGFIGPAVSMYQTIQTGEFVSHDFLGWYHILTSVLVAAFYLPLAIKIRRLTKEAGMRGLKGFSTFIIVALSVFLVFNTIAIIVGLINPGFFV